MVTNKVRQEIIRRSTELVSGQFLLIVAPWTAAIYRDNESGDLREYSSIFSTRFFHPDDTRGLMGTLRDQDIEGYRVYDSYREFQWALRDTVLKREMKDLVEGRKDCVNFKLIWEESEEKFGRKRVKDGFFFVGATMSDEDYYYLYWDPETKKFTYSSCVGPIDELTDEILPESLYRVLRNQIETDVTDAMFPNRALSIEA